MNTSDLIDILQAIGIIGVAIGCICNTMSINRLLNRNGSVNIYISPRPGETARIEEKPSEPRTQTSAEEGESKC